VSGRETQTLESQIAALLDAGQPAKAGRLARARTTNAAGPELLRLLAVSRARLGDDDEAERLLRAAARRQPPSPMVHSDLGVLLAHREAWRAAAAAFARAVKLDPSDRIALLYLATARRNAGRIRAAIRIYRQLLKREPAQLDALEGLIEAAKLGRDLESALPELERALAAAPREGRIRRWLTDVHFEHGRDELGCKQLTETRLHRSQIDSILLHTRLGDPLYSVDRQRDAYGNWIRRYTEPPARARVRPASRARRKLRIGYLTGEFTRVPAYYFLSPLLYLPDAEKTRLFGYHSRAREDEHTAEFHRCCSRFHRVAEWSDDRLAEQIRRDGIDILVDMSGHFDDNRLAVFRQRPAPVSFTYPNYPATSGVPEIDYIFTDRWVDPPDGHRRYVETPWRLPSGYLAYAAPRNAPAVAPPPVLRNGHITFGLMQKPLKLHAGVWDGVAQCLLATPRSRLIIQYASEDLDNSRSAACCRMRDEFARRGVSQARIQFRGARFYREYLNLRAEIDICLDAFPYNGQTTTCDSLWMGVPTITLAGETHVSRVGYSLLARVGLDEWVASSPQSYVELAAHHAADIARLTRLRQTLRKQVRDGLNGRRLAREAQNAFLEAARLHCG
jgi:protein O-GlcNAc transferase